MRSSRIHRDIRCVCVCECISVYVYVYVCAKVCMSHDYLTLYFLFFKTLFGIDSTSLIISTDSMTICSF